MNYTGLFASTFDPLTKAHLATIKLALEKCDHLVLLVLDNHYQDTTEVVWYETKVRADILRKVLPTSQLDKMTIVEAEHGQLVTDFWKKI